MWGFGSGEEGPHSRWEAEGRMLNLTWVSQTEEINACVVGFGGQFDRNIRQFANFFWTMYYHYHGGHAQCKETGYGGILLEL